MTGEIGCGSLFNPGQMRMQVAKSQRMRLAQFAFFLLSVGHRPNGRKFFMTPKNFEQVQIQWQQTSESPRVSESALESQDN